MGMATRLLFYTTALTTTITAHDHHGGESKIPEGETVSTELLGIIMWIHIFIQMLAHGVVFPIGMVLGIGKSRRHVPTRILGTAPAIAGFFLGHAHTGREFTANNVHASFAWILQILLSAQIVPGLYVKAHWEKGRIDRRIRKVLSLPLRPGKAHADPIIDANGLWQDHRTGILLGRLWVSVSRILSWVVRLLAMESFSLLQHILLVSHPWLWRSGRSQEFYDSAVIAIFGCINMLTNHQ
ncbi:hypothetical protein BJY00DRAFT_319419 [Aspergillus carlsbadensis]|nr:hypothetical protein BJY00DRAFT_319419 [Aspergillus carlsbadensis]